MKQNNLDYLDLFCFPKDWSCNKIGEQGVEYELFFSLKFKLRFLFCSFYRSLFKFSRASTLVKRFGYTQDRAVSLPP